MGAAQQIDNEYVSTGQVRWVFRDLPLISIHPQAVKSAEAARCAGELGGHDAFWAMHDKLFETQPAWAGNEAAVDLFKTYAQDLDIDHDAYNACLDNGDQEAAVMADFEAAGAEGFGATPSFVLGDGTVMEGARPFEAFQANFDTLLAGGTLPTPTVEPTIEWEEVPAPVADVAVGDAPAKGDPDAPVTIIEYSDYQCPYCAQFVSETYPDFIEQFVDTGRVYYAFKDLPLFQIHPVAIAAAQAAHCARDQGGDDAYWAMHDALFADQAAWSETEDPTAALVAFAEGLEIELDGEALNQCLVDGTHAATVEASFTEAVDAGLTGTPSFVMNGQLMAGAYPLADLAKMIEDLEAGEPLKTFQPKEPAGQ